MKINHLTTAEENLMNIMWRLDSAYMKEVLEQYVEPKPHQNTISTFMKILVEKDFLTTEKEGRIFKYSVAVPFTDYKKFVLQNFLSSYFNDSGSDLLKTLIDEKLIAASDLQSYFDNKTTIKTNPTISEEVNPIIGFIDEITSAKRKKKKKKSKKKEGKKKK